MRFSACITNAHYTWISVSVAVYLSQPLQMNGWVIPWKRLSLFSDYLQNFGFAYFNLHIFREKVGWPKCPELNHRQHSSKHHLFAVFSWKLYLSASVYLWYFNVHTFYENQVSICLLHDFVLQSDNEMWTYTYKISECEILIWMPLSTVDCVEMRLCSSQWSLMDCSCD
jgi:hypothetical protein